MGAELPVTERGYTHAMSTDTDTTAPPRSGNARAWTIAFWATVVVTNSIGRLAGIPWWALGAPFVAIGAVMLTAHWTKTRRSEAVTSAD